MDYGRNAMLVLGVVICTVALVSGQVDMSVTYTTSTWFPVGETATLQCQVEHTENRDALSVYWSRQKEGAQTYEKIGAYDSRDNSTYNYASAPQDIADRFVLSEDAYDDSTLTATSRIMETSLSDAGTYQCEVEDTKAHMAKAAAFDIQVYSLPSSVIVVDGNTFLSMLPVEELSGDGAVEEPEVEAIASCIVEGVFPVPSQIDFTDKSGEVLQSITDVTISEGDDGLYTVTADLVLDASRSLHGEIIGCTVVMAEGIDLTVESTTTSSAIEVLYPTEVVTLKIGPLEIVNEGDEVTISCEGDGNPAPEVTITGPSGDEALSSFVAGKSDAGTYTCTADGWTVEETLEVYYIRAPTLSTSDQMTVSEGDDVKSNCTAEGNPEPSIKWYSADGSLVADSGELNIPSVPKDSSGQYTCKAENLAGVQPLTLDVSVQYGCKATFEKEVSYSMTSAGKAYVQLTCVAKGDPTCQVTISGDGCDGAASMGESKCEIPAMEPQTSPPEYTCTATNGIGTSTQTVKLNEEPVYVPENGERQVETAGMPAGGIAAIIIIIVLVVIGVPAACYYCRRQRTPSTKNAKAMEAGEDEKLADAENQE